MAKGGASVVEFRSGHYGSKGKGPEGPWLEEGGGEEIFGLFDASALGRCLGFEAAFAIDEAVVFFGGQNELVAGVEAVVAAGGNGNGFELVGHLLCPSWWGVAPFDV